MLYIGYVIIMKGQNIEKKFANFHLAVESGKVEGSVLIF